MLILCTLLYQEGNSCHEMKNTFVGKTAEELGEQFPFLDIASFPVQTMCRYE